MAQENTAQTTITQKNIYKIYVWLSFLVPYVLDRLAKLFSHDIVIEPVRFLGLSFFHSFGQLDQEAVVMAPVSHISGTIVGFLFVLFSIFLFGLVNYIFSYKHFVLRVAFGLLFSGVFCFILDYILYQEFFTNNLALALGSSYISFSVALLVFLTGIFLTFYLFVLDGKNIVRQSGLRKNILLQNKNQKDYILAHFLVFSAIYIVMSMLIYLFFFFGTEEVAPEAITRTQLVTNFILFLVLGYLFSSGLVFLALLTYSNRIYGPVYGFERYVNSLTAQGKGVSVDSFKTRKNDHFKELEKVAEYIRTRIIKKL